MRSATKIKKWIQKHFSDQTLAEVYALNQDGGMIYENPSCCLLSVTEGIQKRSFNTYERVLYTVTGAGKAETAYLILGVPGLLAPFGAAAYRRWRLGHILKSEMKRRDRIRMRERLALCAQDEPATATPSK